MLICSLVPWSSGPFRPPRCALEQPRRGCSFDFLLLLLLLVVVVVVVVAVAVAVVVGGGGWLCFLLCIVGLVGKDPGTVGDPYMVARSTFSGIPAQVVLVLLYMYLINASTGAAQSAPHRGLWGITIGSVGPQNGISIYTYSLCLCLYLFH